MLLLEPSYLLNIFGTYSNLLCGRIGISTLFSFLWLDRRSYQLLLKTTLLLNGKSQRNHKPPGTGRLHGNCTPKMFKTHFFNHLFDQKLKPFYTINLNEIKH